MSPTWCVCTLDKIGQGRSGNTAGPIGHSDAPLRRDGDTEEETEAQEGCDTENRVVGAYLVRSSSLSLGCGRAAEKNGKYLLEIRIQPDDLEQGTPGSVLGLHGWLSTQWLHFLPGH